LDLMNKGWENNQLGYKIYQKSVSRSILMMTI